MPTPIDATKSALRAQVIAARDAVDEGERARKSRAICDWLKAHAEEVAAGRKGLTVTAFRAMGSEVDVSGFVRWALEAGWRAAYPCMLKRSEATALDVPGLPVMRFRYVTAAQLDDEVDAFFKHPMKSYASADPLLAESPLCEPEAVDLAVAWATAAGATTASCPVLTAPRTSPAWPSKSSASTACPPTSTTCSCRAFSPRRGTCGARPVAVHRGSARAYSCASFSRSLCRKASMAASAPASASRSKP